MRSKSEHGLGTSRFSRVALAGRSLSVAIAGLATFCGTLAKAVEFAGGAAGGDFAVWEGESDVLDMPASSTLPSSHRGRVAVIAASFEALEDRRLMSATGFANAPANVSLELVESILRNPAAVRTALSGGAATGRLSDLSSSGGTSATGERRGDTSASRTRIAIQPLRDEQADESVRVRSRGDAAAEGGSGSELGDALRRAAEAAEREQAVQAGQQQELDELRRLLSESTLSWVAGKRGLETATWPTFGGPQWTEGQPGYRSDWYLEPLPWTYDSRLETSAEHLDRLGVVFSGVPSQYMDAYAQLAYEMGFRNARIEVGALDLTGTPGDASTYRLQDKALAKLSATLEAVTGAGLRPLLLLNSHTGWPPMGEGNRPTLQLAATAEAGATTIDLAPGQDLSEIIPNYTGLNRWLHGGSAQADPLITAVDGNTLHLAKPLAEAIEGEVHLATLLFPAYGPHGDAALEQAGADGYAAYGVAIAEAAASLVGVGGFDLEIYNEPPGLGSGHMDGTGTPGADWASDVRYFQDPDTGYTYGAGAGQDRYIGGDAKGPREALVARIAHAVRTALPGFDGDIHNGAGNKLPWHSAGNRAYGTTSFGTHAYSGIGDPVYREQGKAGWPEQHFWATRSEHLTRRINPERIELVGPSQHGSEVTTPEGRWGGGETMEFWMTETGFVAGDDAVDGQWELRAKATARMAAFNPAKGIDRTYLYSLGKGSHHRLINTEAANAALKSSGGVVTDAVREAAGSVYRAMANRATALTAEGNDTRLAPKVAAVDAASDQRIADGPGGAVRTAADEMFTATYRRGDGAIVLESYVVTRDIEQPLGDVPTRITLDLADGADYTATAVDAITGNSITAEVGRDDQGRLVVRFDATDTPRLIVLKKA